MFRKKKEYYSMAEVTRMVDLKSRMVKYRMVKVREKYMDNPKLLFKGNKEWQIHESIIFEFDRQRLSEKEKANVYRTFATVSPWGNYDAECLVEVAKDIHQELSKTLPNIHLYYFIERGLLGEIFHLHFVTNLPKTYKEAIERVSNNYLVANVDVRPITQQRELLEYLHKEVRDKGYLGNGSCMCTIVDLLSTCKL